MTRAFARVALLRATFERNLTIDRNLTKQIVADALPYSQRGNKEAVCPGSRACSSMNTPPRFEGPSCLIVLCGLLRYYREGWRAAQDKVIAANPDVSFAVALLTSAHLTCTDKDRKHGECPCIEKLPGERSMQATIQALVQPLPLVYLQISQHGGNGNQQPHFMYRLAQGWRGLQKHGLAQAFGHVLVLRPDAVLSQPLPLAVTCTDRRVAAFNVISSNFVRPMHFHTRDWDYGYLACDPRSVNLWLWPFFDASPVDALCTKDTLGSTCPALPTVFTGNWTSKDCVDRGNRECAALRLFNAQARRAGPSALSTSLSDRHLGTTQPHLFAAQSEFELSNLDALPVFADLLLNREEKVPTPNHICEPGITHASHIPDSRHFSHASQNATKRPNLCVCVAACVEHTEDQLFDGRHREHVEQVGGDIWHGFHVGNWQGRHLSGEWLTRRVGPLHGDGKHAHVPVPAGRAPYSVMSSCRAGGKGLQHKHWE